MNESKRLSFLRDKRTHRTWLVLVLCWALFRAFAINKFFGQHDVNAWGYLFVDITSSVPYAIYSAKSLVNFLDARWPTFRENILLTALYFYIPDIYVLIFARTVPTSLYVGFGLSMTVFTLVAILSFKKDIKRSSE